jgi:hypothetical protein
VRYYSLIISNPTSGQIYQPDSTGNGFTMGTSGATFTSHPNGTLDRNALNIEFQCLVYPFHTPQGGTQITVSGVGLGMIAQATNLNPDPDTGQLGANIKLSGGLYPGLPLATAAYNAGQSGLLIEATVLQAYGYWQGTDQTLEIICLPVGTTPDQGFCFFWPAGTSLQSALTTLLKQAMPGYTPQFSISPNLMLQHDEAGTYDNLQQFASFLQEMTQADGSKVYGSRYSGVQLSVVGQKIRVFDNTVSGTAKQLAITDIIGQPTWVEPNTISFKTTLRADLSVGDSIQFPTTTSGGTLTSPYVLTTPAAARPGVSARSKTIFQGTFTITEVHHFANSRMEDADSWATAFTAVPLPTLNPIVSPVAIPSP